MKDFIPFSQRIVLDTKASGFQNLCLGEYICIFPTFSIRPFEYLEGWKSLQTLTISKTQDMLSKMYSLFIVIWTQVWEKISFLYQTIETVQNQDEEEKKSNLQVQTEN